MGTPPICSVRGTVHQRWNCPSAPAVFTTTSVRVSNQTVWITALLTILFKTSCFMCRLQFPNESTFVRHADHRKTLPRKSMMHSTHTGTGNPYCGSEAGTWTNDNRRQPNWRPNRGSIQRVWAASSAPRCLSPDPVKTVPPPSAPRRCLGHCRCMGSLDERLFGVLRLKVALQLLHALADCLADCALRMHGKVVR